jgi:hypothetical protein
MKLPLFLAAALIMGEVSAQQNPPVTQRPRPPGLPVPSGRSSPITVESIIPVEGAFGFKLGDVFKPGPDAKRLDTGKFPVYEVKPPSPNPAFATYTVAISPASQRVVIITATTTEGGSHGELFAQVQLFLNQKYAGDANRMASVFARDSRKVNLEVPSSPFPSSYSASGPTRVRVEYIDETLHAEALQQLADQERKRVDEERKKLLESFNSTGL